MKRIFTIMSILAVLGVAAALWFTFKPEPAPVSPVVMLDGSQKSTADWKGKVTLVNFWATSCVTCVGEMPMLIDTQKRYQDKGYRTLAIAMQYDQPSYVVNFAKTRQLPFDVALDTQGQAARDWGNIAITPTTFLLNKRGEIVKRYVGAPDEKELHALIEKLLAQA